MERKPRIAITACMLGLAWLSGLVSAAPPAPLLAAQCDDDSLVEEIAYREVVVSRRCRLVPETKTIKKTVYSYKEVPYCKPACPNPFKRCGDSEQCTACECEPRCKRVLTKREVSEKQTTYKCVVEEEKQLVPYKVYRIAPQCEATPTAANVK